MVRATLFVFTYISATAAAFVSTNRLQTSVSRDVQSSRGAPTMKIFDWKRREADESDIAGVDTMVFYEHNLKPAPGSTQRKKRKGRGISAGQGATCGFGMRGQKSRSGRPAPPGFEGGQTPLYRRLPKLRGRPLGPGHKRVIYNPVKLDVLNSVAEGSTVTMESLLESKALMKNSKIKINKIVGGGDLTVKNLEVKMHAFTTSAREAIEGAGGKCVVISPTTGAPVEA